MIIKMCYNKKVIYMNRTEVNNIVEGQITGITKYGIFVSLEDNYTGMVHISEVSNKYINDLQSKYKIGDVIKVKIISIDEDKLQVKLSIKKMSVNKKNRTGITEKGGGFGPLKEKLPLWTEEKLKELEKNQNLA